MLRRVKQTTLDAYDHQEMTLDQVVAAVNPPRDMSRHPLFQVMFALHNFDLPQMDPHGFNISGLEDGPAVKSAFFDLTLAFWQSGAVFRGEWNFRSDLFEAETIQRMVGHFHVLLAAAIAQPDRSLSSLPLLPDEERTRVTVDWNATAADYPRDVCFHGRSPPGRRKRPRPRQWCSKTSVGPIASWTRRRIELPGSCNSKASAEKGIVPICAQHPKVRSGKWRPSPFPPRRRGSASAWSARRGCWRPSWAFSRRAAFTCRSIRPTRGPPKNA